MTAVSARRAAASGTPPRCTTSCCGNRPRSDQPSLVELGWARPVPGGGQPRQMSCGQIIAARQAAQTRFTAPLHHVDVAALERAFRRRTGGQVRESTGSG
jgi:hypothetical protein